MPTKITYLVSHYPAISHTFFLTEINHLRQHGFDVDVASINPCDRLETELTQLERSEKQRTFYVKSSGLLKTLAINFSTLLSSPLKYLNGLWYAYTLSQGSPRAFLYRLFYLVEAVVVAQRMKQNGSTHLHVHFGSEVATVALLAKCVSPITLSLTIHGSDEFYDVSEFHLAHKVAEADFIFCISYFTCSQLMRLSSYQHWRKIILAPLGIDIDRFSPVNNADGLDETSQLNVLCVGRLNGAKGLHILLHAIARLAPEFPKLKLTLVGDGEERESLQQLSHTLNISHQVEFVGAVNQDRIMPHYQQANIFCLPSFAEGVPVVLMEAMAMELPCITSRINGIPELIEDKKDGLLVNAGDIDSLEKALSTLLKDPQQRLTLGKSARCKVEEKYNLQTNFNAIADHFREQLNQPDNTSNAYLPGESRVIENHV